MEHHFRLRVQEFERSNLQKFKCPGIAWDGGGGGGVLKFGVDWRIMSTSPSIQGKRKVSSIFSRNFLQISRLELRSI